VIHAFAMMLAASHWPMQVGGRWEMTSAFNKKPMVFEVTGELNGVFRVRWENPWVQAEFGFKPAAGRVDLASLDMGQGIFAMPEGTVYFDFEKPEGGSWSNALGTITVVGKPRAVQTPSGKYENCIEIRARDTKGSDTFWTFAPGVGPVRFGQGRGAFLLANYRVEQPAPAAPTVSAGSKRWIAIDANPPPNEGYSRASKENRAKMARQAGANFLYYAPKWNELEPSEGRYQTAELEERFAVAQQNGWPVALNIRTVDTNQRSMPGAYARWDFGDPKTADRLTALLRKVAELGGGQVRWLTIGNEANDYFKSRKGEIRGYEQLLRRVIPAARELFPGVEVSVNFTWYAMGDLSRDYKPLVSLCDFVSLTYYPLNADLTFRPPGNTDGDIANMVRYAGGKRVFLQEVGYASSDKIASAGKQAEFITRMFAALRANPGVMAANFVWMSDLPDSVVEDLTKYYSLAGNSNFREYLATLGYFDKNGRAKPAWDVLRREAAAFTQ